MSKKPNILWFCSDQQRYDTIRALGNPYIDTPNLDRLCSEGVAFTSAYVQNPTCTPSRASFLSGKYPSSINANILGNRGGPEHCTLITKALADAGYTCGNLGKFHLNAAWEGHEERCDDGYSVFEYNHESGLDFDEPDNAYSSWLREKGYSWSDIFAPNANGEGGAVGVAKESQSEEKDPAKMKAKLSGSYLPNAPVELRQTAWCAERAEHFFRENIDRPWLLTINCFDPHPPFDAPESYVQKYLDRDIPDPIFNESDIALFDQLKKAFHQSKGVTPPNDAIRRIRASYYGMCEIIDMHFGRIVDTLDKLGLRENTVIIYTSDHGEMLGDHGLTHKGCRFYEGAVRVPMIISWPSHIKSGAQYNGLVELTDIAPTLAEICGIDFSDTHGHSLTPQLGLTDREPYEREYVRCEYYDSCAGNKTSVPTYATMFRDKRYKLVDYHGLDAGELYDLKEDPREEHNLWFDEKYSELRFKLLKRSFDISEIVQRPGQLRIGRY